MGRFVGGQTFEYVDLRRSERNVASETRRTLQPRHTDSTGATPDALVFSDERRRHGVHERLSRPHDLFDLSVDRPLRIGQRLLQGTSLPLKTAQHLGRRRQAFLERFELLHQFEYLVLEGRLTSFERFQIGLQCLSLLRRGDRSVVELRVDMDGLALDRGDLIFEAPLFAGQPISFRPGFGDPVLNGSLTTIEFGECRPFGQRGPTMAQLVGGGVVGLQVEQSLEVAHRPSLVRTDPCCRIDQLVAGMVVEVDVVDEVDEVVEVDEERVVVVVPGRVVVVVLTVVVVVVDSGTVTSAPFRIP